MELIFEMNDNWMGDSEEPLKGFSWMSGTKRDTTGILIWSDIFLHTIDTSGEKIAILVMDTQGLFDTESTPSDNSRIFALGTLISSIQVLNLKSRVQEDQLQYLQFATEFAKFNAKTNSESPFQNLTILIRDWENDEEFPFGIDGGRQYFEEEVLKIKPSQKLELKSVRESIRNSFESIECCLLPHPGKHVACRKEYDGRWSKMDEEFKIELKKVIEMLFSENMILKKINSQEVTGAEFKNYIIQFFRIFQSGNVPETKSIYEQTVESNLNNLIKKCIDDYKLTMFRNKELITDETIQTIHQRCKERSLELFNNERKMGTIDHEEKFKYKLDEEIESIFKFYTNQNDFFGQEIEEEIKRQQALIDKEEKQRLEAEKAKEQAERKMKELKEAKHNMENSEYKRQLKIAEARRNAEKKRLQSIDNQVNEESSFKNFLIYAIGGLGLSFLTVGVAPTLAAVTEGAVVIGRVASAIAGTASVVNRCSIM